MYSLIYYLVLFAVEKFDHQPVKTQICLLDNMKVNSVKYAYSSINYHAVTVLIVFIVINVLIWNSFFMETRQRN